MELFADDFGTTLTALISTTPAAGTSETITVNVAPPAALMLAGGTWRIKIDAEIMVVTAVGGTGNKTWTVRRGAEGTATATHANGATVDHFFTAGAANWLKSREVRRSMLRLYRLAGGGMTDDGSNRKTLTNGGGAALTELPGTGVDGGPPVAGWTFTQSALQKLTATDAGLPSGAAPRTLGTILRTTTGATGARWVLSYGNQTGEQGFGVYLNGATIAVDTFTTTRISVAATGVNDGNAHLVAATYDGETLSLVLDGVVLSSTALAISTVLQGASGYHVGDYIGNTSAAFGFIGDVALPFGAPYAADPRDLTIANLVAFAS